MGRTGTYIALDALYREGKSTGKINVPMYVRTMRKDRMNMIQGDVGSFISTTNLKSQNKKIVSNFDKYDKRKVKKT